MYQGSCFNLENVIRQLSRTGTSVRWMYASHSAPLKASANRRGENLAVAIKQCQRA